MSIEIAIIYSPDSVTISAPKHIFPEQGGTLGRGADNFWVLEDPNKYMSSVHANIESLAGGYYLTDLSTNGTFINGATEPVGNGNKVLLNEGDHFTISDYEFSVKIDASLAHDTAFAAQDNLDPFASLAKHAGTDDSDVFNIDNNDPFSDYNAIPSNNDPFAPASNNQSHTTATPLVNTEQQTDPLILLDEFESINNDNPFGNNPDDLFNVNQNHLPKTTISDVANSDINAMNESLEWPKVNQEVNHIPDDWDVLDDDLSFNSEAPLTALNNAPQNITTQNQFPEDPFGQTTCLDALHESSHIQSEQPLAMVHPAAGQFNHKQRETPAEIVSTSPIGAQVESDACNAELDSLKQQNVQLQEENNALKIQLANALQKNESATSSLTSNDIASLDKVVDAMGLAKWNLDETKKIQINETVGLLMRETMQGMMQVLKFRKKIKEEFRINVTTIQSVENNPLKFSANIDDALENMFIKENNAYKVPVDAVKEGFQGIAEHQVAVVAGMQAAFRGMIERFNPDNLESRFEKYKSNSLLSLGQKSKRWNAYKEYHQGLTENIDDSFQHLFGYDFVQAYEEQMQNLISARITKHNQVNQDLTK